MFEKYPNLTPLQRSILSSTGTVQSLLSAIFKKPVIAKVISQRDVAGVYIRWVRLCYPAVNYTRTPSVTVTASPNPDEIPYFPYSSATRTEDVTVALAESVFPHELNNNEILDELRKGEEGGIGQVLVKKGIRTEREILGIYVDDNVFTRTYRLSGDGVDAIITEVFPNNVFKGIK